MNRTRASASDDGDIENMKRIVTERPPSFVSRKKLAWELNVSESTVDELVRRGIIPRATKLTPGCVRWSWTAVETALASLTDTADNGDQFMQGASNAIKTATEGRGGVS